MIGLKFRAIISESEVSAYHSCDLHPRIFLRWDVLALRFDWPIRLLAPA